MGKFKGFFGGMLFACLTAVLVLAAPAMAATPIQGTSAGAGFITVKVNKNGQIVGAHISDNTAWNGSVSLTNGTSTAVKTAAGAGVKNCITSLDWNGISTTTQVTITLLDGASAKWAGTMLAGGAQIKKDFPTPICGTANTALNVQLSGSPTGAIQVNAQGYTEPN